METFIKRKTDTSPGFNIGVILNKKPTPGVIGLEIEVEGANLPKQAPLLPKQWVYHHDGSLRGEDNAEYTLAKPLPISGVEAALDDLWKSFETCKSRLDESNRTSVHVHLNCQDFYINRLASFIALYFCFEEILTEWCGEHRVGNLFCLRGKDAPATVTMIRKFLSTDGKALFPESVHYAGLNVHALQKFGSIEIRTLRGVSDKSTILDWVGILLRLYEVSDNYQDPRDICGDFSRLGPSEFFETILGDHAETVRNGVEYDETRIRDSMYEGIRLAQGLCYCRDWDSFKKMDIKPDPFGRDVRKIAKKLVQNSQNSAPATIDEFAQLNAGWILAAASPPNTGMPQFTVQPIANADGTLAAAFEDNEDDPDDLVISLDDLD